MRLIDADLWQRIEERYVLLGIGKILSDGVERG